MNQLMKLISIIIVILLVLLATGLQPLSLVSAAEPGNVWVSTGNTIIAQYTPTGTLVTSSVAVPDVGGDTPVARDLLVGSNGLIHLYNGTFDPYLSTYNTGTLTWTRHQTYTGWSTTNTIGYGGIARYQNYLFVTDMNTFGATERGIVRFDATSDSALRFANTEDYIDVALGLDNLLYSLRQNQYMVDVFHPQTTATIRTITLDDYVRGIAVNQQGQVFGASWDGNIYHFATNGSQLNSIASGVNNLTDIDLTCDGQIAVGSWNGNVLFTNEALGVVTSFDPGTGPTFVAFSRPNTSCVYLPVIIR